LQTLKERFQESNKNSHSLLQTLEQTKSSFLQEKKQWEGKEQLLQEKYQEKERELQSLKLQLKELESKKSYDTDQSTEIDILKQQLEDQRNTFEKEKAISEKTIQKLQTSMKELYVHMDTITNAKRKENTKAKTNPSTTNTNLTST